MTPLPGSLRVALVAIGFATQPGAAYPIDLTQPYWQLWTINADGSGLKLLLDSPGYTCGSPKYSPDGKLIAFDTRKASEMFQASQIAVIHADGTHLRVLCPGGMPSWSPDGSHLVFHTYDNPQTIAVMRIDGSGRETIVNHWGSPRWLPAGNRIAMIGADRGLTLFDLATGIELGILTGPHSIRPGFAVSPDGKQFCYGEESGGVWLGTLNERLMQIQSRKILNSGTCCHAAWSPDAKRLVFGWKSDLAAFETVERRIVINDEEAVMKTLKPGASLYKLMMLDLSADFSPLQLSGPDEHRNNTNPDWSPDGKTIVFSSEYSPLSTRPKALPQSGDNLKPSP